jgi:hypothetical protein
MTQDHNDDDRGLIVDDDPALDFTLPAVVVVE